MQYYWIKVKQKADQKLMIVNNLYLLNILKIKYSHL